MRERHTERLTEKLTARHTERHTERRTERYIEDYNKFNDFANQGPQTASVSLLQLLNCVSVYR